MSTFKPNDKVVCIDATPIPIGAPNNVVTVRQSGESLYITGPYVLLNNQLVPWNGKRFRKVERNKEKMEQKAETKNATQVRSSYPSIKHDVDNLTSIYHCYKCISFGIASLQ
jgi:hypothetical protein